MAEHTTPSMNSSDVYAEGKVSPSEAEQVMANLTNGSVGVEYNGPRGLEDRQLVEPQEAAEVLNTALEYAAQMTPDERLEREEAMEALGFDNSAYGSGSVVQELVEGHGEQGTDTPVYLMVDFNEDIANEGNGVGSGIAVVVDNLQTAARSTEEDYEANLTFTGNMAGELGEAYQTVADL
ncbi:MAG: hypothetical protein ABEJ95_05135 [Candidatus Nanohalobium sp.]